MTYTVDMVDLFNALTELSSNLVHVESSCSPSQSPAVPQTEPPTLGSSPAPVPASPLKHACMHTHAHRMFSNLVKTEHTQADNIAEICSLVSYLKQRMTSLPPLPL